MPEVVVNRDCLTYRLDDRYTQNIIVRKLKSTYPSYYVRSSRLELDGKFGAVEEIQMWNRLVRERYSEDSRDRILYRVFTDQKLLVKELKPIIEQLISLGEKRIAIVTLNPDFQRGDEVFECVAIQDINLKSNLTLGELLY